MGLRESIAFRLRALFRNAQQEDEMDREMRAHFDQLVDDYKAEGFDDRQALTRARKDFGNMDRAKEECRDNWGARIVFDFWRDSKQGARELRKNKGFSIVCALTLGLAMGACATVFSALDAALFRPLPYPEPDRLVALIEVWPRGEAGVSGGAFRDWRDHGAFFESLALHAPVTRNLQAGDGPIRLHGREVSSGFLDTLGIPPLLGRGFLPSEDDFGGSNRVAMLSERAWRNRFSADPALIGQTILLDTVPHEVIGVLPSEAWTDPREEIFVPAVIDPSRPWRYERDAHWAQVWARLKLGISAHDAESEMVAIRDRLLDQYPEYKRDWTFSAIPLQERLAAKPLPILLVLIGAAASVLLIACANVANLLLARAAQREREMALRAALGATKGRMARQTFTESLLLAAIGGALGVAIAFAGIALLRLLAADLLPMNMTPQLDGRVLAASIALSCGAGLLLGALPAWTTRQFELGEALKKGGRAASGRRRPQSILAIAEVALTVSLLTSAGLFLLSVVSMMNDDPGFEPERGLTFELFLPENQYPGSDEYWRSDARMRFVNTLVERIGALPGVLSTGASTVSPLAQYSSVTLISRDDQADSREHVINTYLVSGDFLGAIGGRMIGGRFLNEFDNREQSEQTIVLDQTLARALFPDDDPIGKRVTTWERSRTVVGVVADMDLSPTEHEGAAYLPLGLYPYDLNVAIRTEGDPRALIRPLRETLSALDPSLPLANLRTLEEALDRSYAPRRLALTLVGGFACAALALACLGIYAVMSYDVSTRKRELSIRRALGGTARALIGLVVKDGGRLTLIGLAVGLPAAIGAGRLLSNQLHPAAGVSPLPLALATAIVATVSLLACWLPARRAASVDFNDVLRSD